MTLKIKIKPLKKLISSIVGLCIVNFAFAGAVGPATSLTSDLSALKESVAQWGSSAALIAIFISGSLAVSSLILPWRFLKDTLGRPAWIGLVSAIFVYIILSFFGNSIHAAITQIVQCPLQIIGFPCS